MVWVGEVVGAVVVMLVMDGLGWRGCGGGSDASDGRFGLERGCGGGEADTRDGGFVLKRRVWRW